MAAFTDYFENKLVDWLLRAQAFSPPNPGYIGLLTAAPTDGSAGTEVTGGAYARSSLIPSLANWAGTQGATTTVASSGTGGTTSNNVAIAFPTPTVSWGLVTHFAYYDALTAGNMLFFAALTQSKTINIGDAVSFAISTLTLQVDN